jgi:glycosyltransferase involved in cell wall biosynthesis
MSEMVSAIIPARKEKYLNKTILEIQEKMNCEIIVVLDGYWAEPIVGIKYIHNEKSKGMRTAINQAVAAATGEYILKLDAHCMVDKDMDKKLIVAHQDNWVQIPRRKRMDAKKWELIDSLDVDYMHINKTDLRGYKDNEKNLNLELKKKLIDDVEIFQGSCYFMTKKYFNKLGLLDDVNFGTMGREALEIVLKCKKDGGRVVVNKSTWYAHARLPRHYGGSMEEREKSYKFIKTLI